mgnify:CR=1 FL=1
MKTIEIIIFTLFLVSQSIADSFTFNHYKIVSQTNDKNDDNKFFEINKNNPKKIEFLENAFKLGSDSLLKVFLDDKIKEPVSRVNLKKKLPIEIAVYKVYEKFYQPFNLSKIGKEEWGDYKIDFGKYIFIQNDITAYIIEKDLLKLSESTKEYVRAVYWRGEEKLTRISLKEFEPDVSFEGFSIIYLTEELKQMLFEFLWGDYSWQIYGTKNKTKPEEYRERWDFF